MCPTKIFWVPAGAYPGYTQQLQKDQQSLEFFGKGEWSPNTDVYEVDDGLVMLMDVAGLNKDKINISVNDNILIISGNRKEPDIPDKKTAHRLEIEFGTFEKRFHIPEIIDTEAIQANYNNGFLQLKLPRAQKKKIDINHE
jgi:HSP20 family protein